MKPIPNAVLRSISPAQQPSVQTWWKSLSPSEQADLTQQWSERRTQNDVVAVLGIPVDPTAEQELDEAYTTLLEFISNHEEIVFFLETREFHICRAHAVARETIRSGTLPASFSCPLQHTKCPMKTVLQQHPQRSIRFLPVLASRVHSGNA